jgi:hypothetical protein
MQLSLFGGTFLRLADDGTPVPLDEPRFGAGTKSPWAAEAAGFNVHAGVTIHAGDREGLERLLRYCARPPFSLERLSLLPDGRVAYLLRAPRRNGATHLVLDPIAFLARIAALIPPPRFPLVRLAGVLAPHSSWRRAVVSRGGASSTLPSATPPTNKQAKKKTVAASPLFNDDAEMSPERRPAPETPEPNGPRTSLGAAVVKPVGARIDWASLLRRIYLEDVLACPCGGRRRIIADIQERDVIVAILAHLRLPTEPPPVARARSPSFEAA